MLSFLLSSLFLIIPFFHNLPFPCYFLFGLYFIQRILPTHPFRPKNKMFELMVTTSLYSYYSFHNIYISYILSSLTLLEFVYSDGLFISFLIFLYAYFYNISLYGNSFLIYPFLFSSFIFSKTFCYDKRTKLSSNELFLWDCCQFYFFWYSSYKINVTENFQC